MASSNSRWQSGGNVPVNNTNGHPRLRGSTNPRLPPVLVSCSKGKMTLIITTRSSFPRTPTSAAHCKKSSLEAASADTSITLGQLSRASGQCLQSRPASMHRVTSCRFSSAYGATTTVTPEPDSIAGTMKTRLFPARW
ncbi:hypothetical protein VE03_10099 [Pseudogymnoascus sp. 23342-1-I1]|nr:hypothetical protein VE03_10099 [Pseudogymnoascus sp. 23342-1-I1]